MDRQIRIFLRVFAGLGVVLLIAASYFYTEERNFVKNGVTTEGVVSTLEQTRDSDGDVSYYPHVTFTTTDGRSVTFRSRTGRNPPAYQAGERIGVIYDPANPERARHTGFFSLYVGTFVLTILTVVFGGIGFTGMWLRKRAAAKAEELRRFGRRIEAKVVMVERNTRIHVNRRNPWRIVAEAEDPETKEMETFFSENLWDNPEGRVGETVSVFIDRQNPRRYCVDTEFLREARV